MPSRVIFTATRTAKTPSAGRKRSDRPGRPADIPLDANPHYFQVASWLLKLRFLTTQQIGRLLDPPRRPRTVYDLLRRMYDARLTSRFDVPFKRKWGEGPTYGAAVAIHCLGRAAIPFLARRLETERSQIDWQPRDNQKHTFLDHRLAANDTLITMYQAAKRLGFRFEIIQSERQVHKKGGHDWVKDPKSRMRRPVKPDAVCRLTLPNGKSAWLSLELDMGTEGEKKIKQKFRLHRQHYDTGKYQMRHATTSSRITFIVADIRDPLLVKPIDEAAWRKRVGERVLTLRRWAEEEGMAQFFWFAPGFALTLEAVWQHPIWLRPGKSDPTSFFN